MKNKLPRNWLAIAIVLIVGILAFFVWRQWAAADEISDVPGGISLPEGESVSAIAAQLHFTFTLPSGWRVQAWQRDKMAEQAQQISRDTPRLRDSLARMLAAFQPASQVLILQPEAPMGDEARFLLLSIPSHGLRLEQIADQFASETAKSRLIDTSLRSDGQPILRIRGDQLTALDSRAIRPKEIAILNNSRSGELLVILEIQPSLQSENLTESAIMNDILRSIEFVTSN